MSNQRHRCAFSLESQSSSPSIGVVPPQQTPTIVSIGYEGRSPEELISLLQHHDVDVLVDVRLNAISRKKGFSKSALADALDAAGIDYRHERELGNPKDNRDAFRRGLKSARSRYAHHLENGASEAYQEVVGLADTTRLALLCVERELGVCHRSSIIESAQRDVPDLTIIDI